MISVMVEIETEVEAKVSIDDVINSIILRPDCKADYFNLLSNLIRAIHLADDELIDKLSLDQLELIYNKLRESTFKYKSYINKRWNNGIKNQ